MAGYKLQPVPLNRVTFTGGFWEHWIKVNTDVTLPHVYEKCEDSGRIDAFDLDPEKGIKPVLYWDSDVAKWLEGACYALMNNEDPELTYVVERVIRKICSAQQPDGYINSFITLEKPDLRWKNLGAWHELYNAGHLIEAAIAHHQATGKDHFLQAMCRYADYIASVFGPEKRDGYPGHQEIELALVKLYRLTGNVKYLDLAKYFLDRRGHRPSVFEEELKDLAPEDSSFNRYVFMRSGRYDGSYAQDHLPVREQEEAVGHAVRAIYMYAAMVDAGAEAGDDGLIEAALKLWDDVYRRKMYITGGIGARPEIEGFGDPYQLPNDTAYAETCAAIASILWNHRLFNFFGEGRFMDVIERTLYNGFLSGISLDGRRFFYDNVLASNGKTHRKDWYFCACCPTNIVRFLGSMGQLVYSCGDGEVYVNLYVAGTGQTTVNGQQVVVKQQTNYPWEGAVKIEVHPERREEFTICLRIPGWCREYGLRINGSPVDNGTTEDGYVKLRRAWQSKDLIEVDLAMPVERVYAHPNVEANVGKVAIQRGPVVYCLEEVDQSTSLERILLPKDSPLEASFERDGVLGELVKVRGEAVMVLDEDWSENLYRTQPSKVAPVTITAIPYYAWDNRASGAMRVWINELR